MSNTMAEAIEESGILERLQNNENEHKIDSAEQQQPKPNWHQQFRLFVTKFEIEIFLLVRCASHSDGSRVVRNRKLNSCLTTRCKDDAEAREQLYRHLQEWSDDATLSNQDGQLIYWKIYDSQQ